MKNLILLLILTATIVSCSQKEELKTVRPSFDLYGTCDLIILNKSTDSVRIEVSNYARILNEEQALDTTISANDSLNYKVVSQGYSYFTLVVNKYYYRVFSAPQSVIRAEVISDSVVNFVGEFDSINNYLAKSSGTYYSTKEATMELVNLTGNLEIDYEGLTAGNDQVIQKHQEILLRNKALLPDWYVDIETKRLSVLGAYFKLNSLSYRKYLYKVDDSIPQGYVDSVVYGVPFKDVRLMGFSDLVNFLQDYSVSSFNPLNDTAANRFKENYMDSLYAHTARFVPQPFSDYSLTSSLSSDITRGRDRFKSEWIELVTDTVFKNFLYKKYNQEEVLPKSAKVPNFTVLDTDSNQFSFSGIKDTVVLINFWASYCKPCFENFPHENELVEQFEDEPVKIINFCMESEFSHFLALVEKYDLKTVNIFADEKKSVQLRKDFDIHGIPHSILIDKNGLVVKNKCSVRGDEIVDEIEGLLK